MERLAQTCLDHGRILRSSWVSLRMASLHTGNDRKTTPKMVAKSDRDGAAPPTPRSSGEGHRGRQRMVDRRDFRFIFPEFLPDPNPEYRNLLSEKLTRRDLLRRREQVEIPEFYVGSIVAVTVADPHSNNVDKIMKFVGIVIERGGTGTRAWIRVRNVVDKIGVEFIFELYSPTLVKIETLRLEKRLDDELIYLRDAPPEHSTFPMNMDPEILPEGTPVPLNDEVIKLKPKPWTKHWENYADRLRGYSISGLLPEESVEHVKKQKSFLNPGWQRQVEKYDLMLQYRETIPLEEQDAIWREVGDALEQRDVDMRKVAAKRAFAKPTKRE